jgi:O-antigen ligase
LSYVILEAMEERKSYDHKVSIVESLIFFFICSILIFAPIAYGAVEPWALGILAILIFLLCTLWLFQSWKTKKFVFDDNSLQLPIIGLILVGLTQLLPLRSIDLSNLISTPPVRSLSLDPYATRLATVLLIIYLIFFAAVLIFIQNEKRVRKIIILIISFGAFFSFIGVLQQLTDKQTIFGFRIVKDAIPFGTFVNRHHFAAFMVMLSGLALGLIHNWTTTKDKKLLLWIAVVLMGVALAMTGSRGAWLSFLGSIVFLLAISSATEDNIKQVKGISEENGISEKSSISKKLKIIISFLVLLFVIFATVIFLGKDEFLARSIGLIPQEDISGGRFHFWSIALQIFKDHPILGAGLDSYATVFSHYDTWNGKFRVERAHNDYLQILADAGLVGFSCIVAFIYLLFKRSIRSIENLSAGFYQRKSKDNFLLAVKIGALTGCVGIMIHSFFDFPLRTNSNSFYFLLLSALAAGFEDLNSFQHEVPAMKSQVGIDSEEAR